MTEESKSQRIKTYFEQVRLHFGEDARNLSRYGSVLGVTHSTIARWLSGEGKIGKEALEKTGAKIGVDPELIADYFDGKIPIEKALPSKGVIRSKYLKQALESLDHLTGEECWELLAAIAQMQLKKMKTTKS